MVTKGQKINERYEIIKSIGEGGMANVYLAYDSILDRNVAIKVLRGDLSNDEKFVRRFQREALSASSLAHPNIVEVYDVGEDNGIYYIVMEYIDGKTIKQLLKKRGNLTLSEAIDIMLQLTDGMAHAHDSYIIHRDLKPQNVMIKDDGSIKITDFGIAMAINATQLTQTNSVMGSVHYLPPEQAAGKRATTKSDIYSMGIIFYELLTGVLPFRGDNAVEIALKHMRDELPSVRDEHPELPQSVDNIIRRATAKNPKNRYDDVRSMHADLLTCLNDDRLNEEKYQYKFPEFDMEATRKIKKIEDDVIVGEESLEDIEKEEKIKEDATDKKFDNITRNILIGLGVILLLVLISFVILVIIPMTKRSKNVEVPDCTNLKVSQCQEKIRKVGLVSSDTIEAIPSDDVLENRVVKTSPSAKTELKVGGSVKIYKSSGKKTIKIENYVGKNYITVKTELEVKYNMVVTVEKKDVDEAKDADLIIGQSLAEGSEINKGDSITLYIPNVVEKYPDMVKEEWSADEVKSFAEKYGLELTIKEEPTLPSALGNGKYGKVSDQSRRAGTKIVKGESLTVVVPIKRTSAPTPRPTSTPGTGA